MADDEEQTDQEEQVNQTETLLRNVVVLSAAYQGTRLRSQRTLLGWPLWEIALGPDLTQNERRGHARAWLAMGDMASGFIAIGGLARGVLALGGLAYGVLAVGGCSLGLIALAGVALGGFACGGVAVGVVAVGGLALGYFFACGGQAFGQHVIDARQQDPQAVQFFQGMLTWLKQLFVAKN